MSNPAVRVVAAVMVAFYVQSLSAANFAVSTKIFVQASVDPASEHRVMFDEGTAYDLPLGEDRFATIYDPVGGKVILLDRQSKVQTIVTLDDLLKVTAQAKASVTEPETQIELGLNAQVNADNQVNADDGYTIKFAGTEYFAKTETPDDSTIAAAYGRFADLALRMNILRPLGPPPFARMTLNSHIAAKGEVATESTLTIKRGNDLVRYRSSNEIGTLTVQDRKSIEQLRGFHAAFKVVPLKEFPN